jgi:hypothetical protein
MIKGRGRSQIPILIPDHKPLESMGQMSFNWGVLYIVGNFFFEGYKILFMNCKKRLDLRKI